MKNTIRWQIMRYFLLVVVIMSFAFLLFYRIITGDISESAAESMKNVLTKINQETYDTLVEAEKIAYLVSKDSDIQLALRGELPDTQKELYKQRIEYNTKLREMSRFTSSMDGFYVLGENGAQFRSSVQSLYTKDFRMDNGYQAVKESRETAWFCSDEGSFLLQDVPHYLISILVPIIDRASYRFLGVTVVDVSMENIKLMAQKSMVFDGMLLLVNEDREIIYADFDEISWNKQDKNTPLRDDLEDELQQVWEQVTEQASVTTDHYLISSMPLDISGWTLVGVVPHRVVFGRVETLRNMVLLVGIICILLSVVMAISASNSIAKPISRIRKAMHAVEKGDLDTQVKVENKNHEIGQLETSFNNMVHKLDLLVKQEEENQEKLRLAEMKALQTQINPHFLYNTLDSINWMARAGQIDEVIEMVNSLSTFFRISLSRGKTFITLDEELRHVENYILIQKKRYEKYLEYEIDVPNDLRKYQCIKMILQPLVENSIYHGIKEKAQKGMISIRVSETDQNLILTVADTGQGMTPEKLGELHVMMQQEKEYDQNAYGVINVQRRIRTYFGKEYGLEFASEWKKGTTVTVTIPKKLTQEERHDLESSTH